MQSAIKIPHIFLWGFLILAIITIFISLAITMKSHSVILQNNRMTFFIAGFCLLFLALGILRIQITEFNIANDNLRKLNDLPQKIILQGKIISEPDIRENSQRIEVEINQLPDGQKTDSVVLVTTGRYPEYNYLDRIKITGQLKTPIEFENFSYKNYLMKEGIYSVADFPKIETSGGRTLADFNDSYSLYESLKPKNAPEFAYSKLLIFKEELKKSININFAPPHNFILEGIILGNDKNMPKELKEKMNATGLSHLTAISGSNIVILSNIMLAFLLFLGFWRGQAFWVSVTFIWLYILIAGFPASGVRAGIMGMIFLFTAKVGRQNTSSRIIILAGAIMLLQNPLLLLYDAGFQLSFLASMGIIHLKPIIDSFLQFGKNMDLKPEIKKRIKNFRDIFSITVSAQIFTLPLIAYSFKNISLIALFTNLLIIPIVNFIMVAGFLSAFLGIFSVLPAGGLGFIFSLPAWISLSYFMKVVDIFYQPWAVVAVENFPFIWILAYYLALAFAIKHLNKYLQPKFLGF